MIIDPQNQATNWLKSFLKQANIKTGKLSDPKFYRSLENCIKFGQPLLLNLDGELDPMLNPVLLRQTYKKGIDLIIGAQLFLKIGDSEIPFSPDFKMYITSNRPNPHYLP